MNSTTAEQGWGLHADKGTRHEIIAQVMAAAPTRGLTKPGFVTDLPSPLQK